jgi:hypothetical protein
VPKAAPAPKSRRRDETREQLAERQRLEMIAMLEEEQSAEMLREKMMKEATDPKQRARLEKIFA